MIKLMFGDCLELMQSIESGSVDLIATDLPYGTTQNKWDAVIPFEPLWIQYRRILKEGGTVVSTASQPFTSLLVTSNLEWFKYELIWKKSRPTGFLDANRKPMKVHENIVVFSNSTGTYNPQNLKVSGKRVKRSKTGDNYGLTKSNDYIQGFTNYPRSVLEFPSVSQAVHPTQKPRELFDWLISTYSNPGETVLDNTMGSGTSGESSVSLGRSFIGIENHRPYYDLAEQRILGTIVPKLEQGSSDETRNSDPSKGYAVAGRVIHPAICQVNDPLRDEPSIPRCEA